MQLNHFYGMNWEIKVVWLCDALKLLPTNQVKECAKQKMHTRFSSDKSSDVAKETMRIIYRLKRLLDFNYVKCFIDDLKLFIMQHVLVHHNILYIQREKTLKTGNENYENSSLFLQLLFPVRPAILVSKTTFTLL